MIFKEKLRNKNSGFTLTELLVVIFIISVLSSLSFVNYRSVKERLIIERAAQKLAQDIRRAQEMAISSFVCPTSICGSNKVYSYGIYLTKDGTTTILYADINPPSESTKHRKYDDDDDIKIEIIPLESGVTISQINTPANSAWLDINFYPPDPTITIRRPGATVTEATTTLSLGSIQKMIYVNRFGLIEVK